MKTKIRKILLAVMLLLITVSLVSCNKSKNESSDNENDDTLQAWNVSAVYSKAQSLGYSGSLEEFIEMVSGKDGADGTGISNVVIDNNGHLIVFLSNGNLIDCGVVASNNGTAPIFKIKNGELMVSYNEGETWSSLGVVQGDSAENGITPLFKIENDILYVSYDEGKEYTSLGSVKGDQGATGETGIGIKASLIDSEGHLILMLTDGSTLDAGKVKTECENHGVFEVTLDYGEGVTEVILSENYRIDAPEIPTREGYMFAGWYFNESSVDSGFLWLFDAYSVTKNMTLYAEWIYIGDTGNDNNGGGNIGGSDWEEEEVDAWWEDITYKPTSLIFQMTKCTNNKELPSGCERYLAGESNDDEQVDEKVRTRNSNAYSRTKVNVRYLYYPDNSAVYGYSLARNEISNTIRESSSETCPDIFCNWMSDLLLCSLKGEFANVMTQNSDYGTNYFNINLTMDSAQNQYGYMSDLMRSLTLNKGQIYVIASDYFIDLIRAFFVVPVNVNLFNRVVRRVDPRLQDYDKSGTVDIDDFFLEVEMGEWTYDRLINYSQATYERAAGTTFENVNDVLGFALGANGLPAAGMIYTSSVSVIKRTYNANTYTWTYTYPDTNADLDALMTKISTMMDIDGIMCMDANDAGILGLQGYDKTALLGIREKFTNDTLLFGGIILVGSLEYEEYQNMKKSGGFGVVPVPVYKKGDSYLTQIHVVGRAGAITKSTTKFSACSAFLQYQAQNSTDILDHYYMYNLSYGAASGVSGNVKMLTYIRNNVRTSFDMLFEDAISYFFVNSGIDEFNRYHTMLANHRYKFDDFAYEYSKMVAIKQLNLGQLEKEYAALPK